MTLAEANIIRMFRERYRFELLMGMQTAREEYEKKQQQQQQKQQPASNDTNKSNNNSITKYKIEEMSEDEEMRVYGELQTHTQSKIFNEILTADERQTLQAVRNAHLQLVL